MDGRDWGSIVEGEKGAQTAPETLSNPLKTIIGEKPTRKKSRETEK